MTAEHITEPLGRALAEMEVAAKNLMLATIARGARAYVRAVHLPKLFPGFTPAEIADTSAAGTLAIVEKLERAMRAEQNRARNQHWSYDGNRTIAIRQALEAERRHLAGLETPVFEEAAS